MSSQQQVLITCRTEKSSRGHRSRNIMKAQKTSSPSLLFFQCRYNNTHGISVKGRVGQMLPSSSHPENSPMFKLLYFKGLAMSIKQMGIWARYGSTKRSACTFGLVSQSTADVMLINRQPSTVARGFYLFFFFNLLFINPDITHRPY